jgi:hypothetical protein
VVIADFPDEESRFSLFASDQFDGDGHCIDSGLTGLEPAQPAGPGHEEQDQGMLM